MTIETMTPAEAVEQLRAMGVRMSPETMRDGLEQGVYPFGECIRSRHGGNVYRIYKRLFDEWTAERATRKETE